MRPALSLWLLTLAVGLAGCTAGQSRLADVARREDASRSPLLSPVERAAVLSGRILSGMSEEMVAASWGVPRQARMTSASGAVETWEYAPRDEAPFGARLTFDHGILVDVDHADGPRFGLAGLESAGPPRGLTNRSVPGIDRQH